MSAQPFHKPAYIGLHRRYQHPIPPFNMLSKLLQIDLVRLTTRRSQTFLHTQIRNKLPHRLRVPRNLLHYLHRT